MKIPRSLSTVSSLAFVSAALLGSCQLQPSTPKSQDGRGSGLTQADLGGTGSPEAANAGADGAATTNTNDPTLSPARRAGVHKDGESIPQILARTREQLQMEITKNLQLTESLQRSNTRIMEIDSAAKTSVNVLETMRVDSEKLQVKIRELQERLVTAALRIASAEKETLEVKIAYEKAVTTAAESGVLLDLNGTRGKPASRPSILGPSTTGKTGAATPAPLPAPSPASGVKGTSTHAIVKSAEHR